MRRRLASVIVGAWILALSDQARLEAGTIDDAQRLFYTALFQESAAAAKTITDAEPENLAAWDVRTSALHFQLRRLLGQMLFTGEEGLKPTAALSGGETARLLFCRIMLQKPNLLIFDEPTNHLDLESINALNIALQKFEGTVLMVTHDQDLLEEVGTRVWHFDHGRITDFKGTFEEYEASVRQ